jgi:hypothetical protein
MSGFITGEGCFYVAINKCSTTKLGASIQLFFIVTQHNRDELLLKSFIEFFGCGNYTTYSKRMKGEFRVTKFSDNTEKIIYFFLNHSIAGVKSYDFKD